MRIVSINAALTESPKRIVFNVDEELSQEFIERIEYGTLIFSGGDKTLTVQLPDNSEAFNTRSVSNLNGELQRISDEFDLAAAKRKRMLDEISEKTGLPLA